MKKKLHNGFLLVAMLLATVGSYVSCKDYDEEAYANMLGENSRLEELINAQVDALNGQIDVLKQAQEECKANCEAWKQQITAWQEYVENNYVTKAEYDAKVLEFAAAIADNKATIANLDTKIDNIKDALEAADAALRSDLNDMLTAHNELSVLVTSLQTELANLAGTVAENAAEFRQAIEDNKQDIEDNKQAIEDLEERVAANESAIATINAGLSTLNEKVTGIETLLNETVKDVVKAYDLAKNDSIRIDALENAYQSLKDQQDINTAKIDSICDELNAVKDSANVALALARENLEKANAYTDERIELAIEELRGNTNSTLADIENAYKAADEALQDQIDALSEALEEVKDRIDENEKKIDELTGKLDKVDESLKQFITGIILQRVENPVFGSYSFPANIQTNILMAYYGYAGSYGVQFPTMYPRYYVRESETLSQKDIEMLGVAPTTLAEDGEALVSGAGKVYVTVNPSNVNFEGQTLPIVNSLDEESGIKLSGLKYSDKKLTFGATRAAVNGFYEAEATLDADNIEKVKMTFDFNASDIKETVKDIINPLDGINVTQVANTMYDVMSQFNQQLDANALKASWTDEMGVSRNIYSQYNLAATAIKPLSYAFMKDVNFTSFPGFDKMRNVAGKLLDKMANKFKVAIDGLPEFDFNVEHIKRIQFDQININTEDIDLNLVVTYKDTIKTSVVINIEDYIDIDVEELVNVAEQTIVVDVPVYGEVKDDEGNVVGVLDITVTQPITIPSQDILVHIEKQVPFEWTGTVPVEVPVNIEVPVDASELQKILNEIDGLEDDVNDLLEGQQDKVNEIIDMVNDYLDKLEDLTELSNKLTEIGSEIDSAKDKIKDKIISYLDKIEDKLLTAVNSINKAVQPMMLVNTTSGFQKLSQTIYSPTVMSAANVQFIPTSYTAEVIAPAYKKLVGVTNVWSKDRSKSAQNGDADCLAALNEANAKDGVAEILDGDTQVVNFSAKKGYIYEVTYTSVDFSGLIAAKKYYVTVK